MARLSPNARLNRLLGRSWASRGVPWLVAALLICVSLLGLWTESRDERNDISRVVSNQVTLTRSRVSEGLDLRLGGLRRMIGRIEEGEIRAGGWRTDASRYLADFPSLTALYRLDADGAPVDRVERQGGLEDSDAMLPDPSELGTIAAGRDATGGILTYREAGGRGYLLSILPIHGIDESVFLGAVIEAEKLFDEILPAFPPQSYRIVISGGRGLRYVNGADRRVHADWAIERGGLSMLGYDLRIEVGAEPGLIATGRSSLTRLTFFLGLIIAVLAGSFTYVSIRSARLARYSTERYRDLYNRVPMGLFRTTLDGDVLEANPAALEIFHASSLEAFQQRNTPISYVDSKAREEWLKRIREYGSVRDVEVQIRRMDGVPIWVSMSLSAVRDGQGEIIAFDGTVEDVSERKRVDERRQELEEQLRQSQKMDAVGRLAGGIAHDFNNLITVINGNTELALSSIPQEHPLVSRLETIGQAASSAADLTSQLLAFGRKSLTKLRVLDLNTVVDDAERMLSRILEEDILLEIERTAEVCRVRADASQMQQVILNLVVNARDELPTGGRICIRTGIFVPEGSDRASKPWCTSDRYGFVEVEDNGPGMDEETRDRLFEPFYTTKETGTGLGLATVYGIVHQHSGHVEVASEPGGGACFRVLIPLYEGDDGGMADQAESVVAVSAGNEEILLIEDEDGVRELVEEILESGGYRVHSCTGPEEAVKLVESAGRRFALLITDVVMPAAGGAETAERIKSWLPDLRVLFMSGYTDDAVLHHGVLNEEVDFIGKPFTATDLLARVREILDRED